MKNMRKILIFLCISIFVFSVYKIYTIIQTGKNEEHRYEVLRQEIGEDTKKSKDNKKDLKKIYEQNHDFVAWLNIPHTPIDYPVMNTPKEPEYYLRRDFHKKYSMSGSLFVGEGAGINSQFIIIYGHNMNNSSMFGTLDDYKDKNFYNSHRVIYLDTPDLRREYKVVGAFDANLNSDKFKYYNYFGDVSDDKFENYMSDLSKYSLYKDYKEIGPTDQILMLSTCADRTGPERFVIVAKRLD